MKTHSVTDIDFAQDASGDWAVWVPREYEAPDHVLTLYTVRHEHPSGRDYIPCADRATAMHICRAMRQAVRS